MPVLLAQKYLRSMQAGQVLLVESTDSVSSTEIPAFCEQTGHILMHYEEAADIWRFWVCCGKEHYSL